MSDNVLSKINDVIKAKTEFTESHYIVASIKGRPSLNTTYSKRAFDKGPERACSQNV